MEEREKMLVGEYYNPRDPELIADYRNARDILQRLSRLHSRDLARREMLFRQLIGHAGEGVWIEMPFLCEYGRHIAIGDQSYVERGLRFFGLQPHHDRQARAYRSRCADLHRRSSAGCLGTDRAAAARAGALQDPIKSCDDRGWRMDRGDGGGASRREHRPWLDNWGG
jgi:hypothetical protein